eukprot:TRINITY_DN37645_c0_g1_i1.p1 TRINITY_DN37645_c0_g1~~TRINITY_DN37645_c0_g1_i1.p1  ORF type:complete len:886 (+),score=167.41 TRINITY_DN37645_c0_g1_i1:153-2660(+)
MVAATMALLPLAVMTSVPAAAVPSPDVQDGACDADVDVSGGSVGGDKAAGKSCAAGAAKPVEHSSSADDVVLCKLTPKAKSENVIHFFGPPIVRNDTWLEYAVATQELRSLPVPALAALEKAVALMRLPLGFESVRDAWRHLGDAVDEAAGNLLAAEVKARFAWRYSGMLQIALGAVAVDEMQRAADAVGPAAGDIRAGLLFLLGRINQDTAVGLLRGVLAQRPRDESVAWRLGFLLQDTKAKGEAVDVMWPVATASNATDARLLATFAFTAATANTQRPGTDQQVMKALARAVEQKGTRAGAVGALYRASLQGLVPFDACSHIFFLERDLAFNPSSCHARLELAWRLLRVAAVPAAVAAGRQLLTGFVFECVSAAEQLTSMGQHWLDEPSHSAKRLGLGGDVGAVAIVRKATRAAAYAVWVAKGSSREGGTSTAEAEWSEYEKVFAAATALKALRLDGVGKDGAGAVDVHHQQKQQRQRIQRKCPVELPSRPLVLQRPPREDPLGCPDVRADNFARCMRGQRPCVLRGVAAHFLKNGGGLGSLDRFLEEDGGNAIVGASFPFAAVDNSSSPTLNSIERTADVVAQDPGNGDPVAKRLPWTLLRPAQWSWRLRDLVDWMRRSHQPAYMNQVMLADLGEHALRQLEMPRFVKDANFTLLSPSIWLNTGGVTTGIHTDALDNFLVQLDGAKEVVLLRPSERKNLAYIEASDNTVHTDICVGGSFRTGAVRFMNRSSDTHSMVNLASPAAVKHFPNYENAQSVRCRIETGDVLFIPAFWHHAVATTPNETSCFGLSVNIWMMRDGKPNSPEQAEQQERDIDRLRERSRSRRKSGRTRY